MGVKTAHPVDQKIQVLQYANIKKNIYIYNLYCMQQIVFIYIYIYILIFIHVKYVYV